MRPILAIALAATLSGCGQSGSGGGDGQTSVAPAPELTAAEQQAIQATLPAPYATADVARGKTLFGVCRSCHTVVPGGANMTGPNLHGVFGRKAAALEDYRYSTALEGSGIVWDPAKLDAWLANPRTFLPGSKMSFAGMKDPQDRTDVIAFLMVESAPRKN